MLSRSDPHQVFSDDVIRQFLLGGLRGKDRSAFERALFLDSELEQRTRLEEIALADDYAMRRLRDRDRSAFIERFLVSTARRNQIEVSTALSECFGHDAEVQRANAWLTLEHPVWKLAFVTMILIMLFATIWVATKEPRLARPFLPHRTRPTAVTTSSPEIAHHAAEHVSEPSSHREYPPAPPSHEATTNAIVIDSATMQENAATVTLAAIHDQTVRAELLVSETMQSTYLAELIDSRGEVVYSDANVAHAANADRVNFDIPIEHLAAGDFQIRLTRPADGKQTTYFLRVR